MVNANKRWRGLSSGGVLSAVLVLTSSVGHAQTPPPEVAPAAATPPPATPAPAEVAPAVITPTQSTIPEDVPPAAPSPPPAPLLVEPAVPPPPPVDAPKDSGKTPITMNAWLRLGAHLQDFEDAEKLDKLSMDGELNLLLNAEVIPMVGLTANLVGTFGPFSPFVGGGLPAGGAGGAITGDASVMDLIARFDVDDAFHVWAGRMLVPSDRTNFSGPWFIAPWFYPGFFQANAPPLGPHQGPSGRNDGATIWGQAAGGMFKYYAGMYDLFSKGASPLFSGRLSLSLISPEPGYYGNSQFYGKKDVLGIGVGVQAQKDGSGGDDDFVEFNADILFEKNLVGGGVLDVEGAFYKYEGDAEPIDYSYFALLSFLIEAKVGPGRIQPLVRLQQAKPTEEDADSWTLVDAQLGYVVDDFACRFALGYQYQEVNEQKGNQIFLGVQLQR